MSADPKEAVMRELNKARCLEERTVGNYELAGRVLSALSNSGYAVVPLRATGKMLDAAISSDDLAEAYEAMVDAAHDA